MDNQKKNETGNVELKPLDDFLNKGRKLADDFVHQALDDVQDRAGKILGESLDQAKVRIVHFADELSVSVQGSIKKIDAHPLISVSVALGVGCLVGIILGSRFPRLGQQFGKQVTRKNPKPVQAVA